MNNQVLGLFTLLQVSTDKIYVLGHLDELLANLTGLGLLGTRSNHGAPSAATEFRTNP
jgi:hypothetical protein